MPTPSQHFSYGQLEGLWISQGGPPHLAPLMAAIAEAESGGSARARNPSGASGLWQILGNPFPGNPFDPETNARMAVAKWKSQGLGAWVTYTSGAYRRFLKHGVAPVSPGGVSAKIPYRNPLRGVKGLVVERVDMGDDYSGRGPIYALGPGVITEADSSWAGGYGGTGPGTFIAERLTAGPLRGHYVYAAENITPAVRRGQKVTAATQIGTVTGGIETGFAEGPSQPGTTLAQALGQIPASGDPGAHPTAAGAAYAKILHALGAPAQSVAAGSAVGQNPSWLQRVLGDIGGFVSGVGGAVGGLGGIGSAIGRIATVVEDLQTAIDWLLQPESWVRIIAGVGGGVLVLGGVFTLSHVGGSIDVPVVGAVSQPAALPVGILEVGGGAVLLFVAFHNLGAANIGDLLSTARQNVQAAAAGQPVAGAGVGQ